ncbi:crossover junction endodeoxyribonuclease RuvC [Fastidiosibacter lacustris]|uniref:crossover junction endodeoxyribonuclease RuvC n=1 Tax=Fastidiosibacter lacustris TaxID=2056695 RepID=UPI000E34CBD0|nr:crossover junction endodeoxyribonuclease RuvC [Fastidiosibacter lacustris]
MIILGIDPGSRITGFGVLKIQAKDCLYLTSGCIRITKENTGERLKQIQDSIHEIISAYRPTEAAIEQIFMFQNPGAALKLGQARGVAMCTLANNNLPINEYSAKQVKQAVVGNGNASKYQVQHMVQTFLQLSSKPQADAADALAIAICHFHSYNSLTYIPGATKIVRGRLR